MTTEKTSANQKPNLQRTEPNLNPDVESNAKPEKSQHIGTFEELLALDPNEVLSITVRPQEKNSNEK